MVFILWPVHSYLSMISLFLTVNDSEKIIEKLGLKISCFLLSPVQPPLDLQENGQRKYGGPPPGWDAAPPERGCEIFIGKLPRDLFEDELIPLCEKVSPYLNLLIFQGKCTTIFTLLSCSFFLVRDDFSQLLLRKQTKPSYLLVMVSALYPFTDSLTFATTDILADDYQIYISSPDLHWHAISLQTPCIYQYRLTLQQSV